MAELRRLHGRRPTVEHFLHGVRDAFGRCARALVVAVVAQTLGGGRAAAARESIPIIPMLVLLQFQGHIIFEGKVADGSYVSIEDWDVRALLS